MCARRAANDGHFFSDKVTKSLAARDVGGGGMMKRILTVKKKYICSAVIYIRVVGGSSR